MIRTFKMTKQISKRKIIFQGKEYNSLENVAKAFGKSRNRIFQESMEVSVCQLSIYTAKLK